MPSCLPGAIGDGMNVSARSGRNSVLMDMVGVALVSSTSSPSHSPRQGPALTDARRMSCEMDLAKVRNRSAGGRLNPGGIQALSAWQGLRSARSPGPRLAMLELGRKVASASRGHELPKRRRNCFLGRLFNRRYLSARSDCAWWSLNWRRATRVAALSCPASAA